MANRCAVPLRTVLFVVNVAISAGAAEPWMRREMNQMILEPSGELIGLRAAAKSQTNSLQPSTCNDNYPMGAPNKNNCSKAHPHHQLIENPWMCAMAAERARLASADPSVNNTDDGWWVRPPWDNIRPKGCFVRDHKYYFNPIAVWPNGKIEGTPVCYESEYDNTTDAGCPAGYAVVGDEITCKAAAACLSSCRESHFRVVNETEQDHRAPGCHYSPSDGCVEFNPKSSPSSPTGTSICNITIAYTSST